MTVSDQIHNQALELSTRYKRCEAELIDILQQVEAHQVFLERGNSSLFNYVITELGLSESTAYSLITVARKAHEVPELKAQIQAGEITLSNARRIAPLLQAKSPESNGEWIRKASELSCRDLEKEIVKVRPEEATRERATYVTENRVKLEVGLSEIELLKLRRVQDLLSQSKKRAVSLEETIAELTAEYLSRHDPLEKAKRAKPSETIRKQVSRPVPGKREPIPAAVLHQVNLRDQRRCTHYNGAERCNQSRWIDIHHKIPVSEGGANTEDNLTTLCTAHHKLWHLRNIATFQYT